MLRISRLSRHWRSFYKQIRLSSVNAWENPCFSLTFDLSFGIHQGMEGFEVSYRGQRSSFIPSLDKNYSPGSLPRAKLSLKSGKPPPASSPSPMESAPSSILCYLAKRAWIKFFRQASSTTVEGYVSTLLVHRRNFSVYRRPTSLLLMIECLVVVLYCSSIGPSRRPVACRQLSYQPCSQWFQVS